MQSQVCDASTPLNFSVLPSECDGTVKCFPVSSIASSHVDSSVRVVPHPSRRVANRRKSKVCPSKKEPQHELSQGNWQNWVCLSQTMMPCAIKLSEFQLRQTQHKTKTFCFSKSSLPEVGFEPVHFLVKIVLSVDRDVQDFRSSNAVFLHSSNCGT